MECDEEFCIDPDGATLVGIARGLLEKSDDVDWDSHRPVVKTAYHPRAGLAYFNGRSISHAEAISRMIERYDLPDETDWGWLEDIMGVPLEEHDPAGDLGPAAALVGEWVPGDDKSSFYDYFDVPIPVDQFPLPDFTPQQKEELATIREGLRGIAAPHSRYVYESLFQRLYEQVSNYGHTLWITDRGKVIDIPTGNQTHWDWIDANWPFPDVEKTGNGVFEEPMRRGWVHVRNHYSSLSFQGTARGLRRNYKKIKEIAEDAVLDRDISYFQSEVTGPNGEVTRMSRARSPYSKDLGEFLSQLRRL